MSLKTKVTVQTTLSGWKYGRTVALENHPHNHNEQIQAENQYKNACKKIS